MYKLILRNVYFKKYHKYIAFEFTYTQIKQIKCFNTPQIYEPNGIPFGS